MIDASAVGSSLPPWTLPNNTRSGAASAIRCSNSAMLTAEGPCDAGSGVSAIDRPRQAALRDAGAELPTDIVDDGDSQRAIMGDCRPRRRQAASGARQIGRAQIPQLRLETGLVARLLRVVQTEP